MRGEWLLPKKFRDRSERYRKLDPGLDFPAQFLADLRAIDSDFYLVWHPYQTLWDNIINEGLGADDNPRYQVAEQYGHLCFGYVMRDRKNHGPAPDNNWHLWRLAEPYGWCHILRIQAPKDAGYLRVVVDMLHKQKQILNQYGPKGLVQDQATANDEAQEKAKAESAEMYKLWQLENSWLLKKAMENMQRGILNSPEPTKDVIMSGQGLNHRSRIIRPITEKEGGIYNPGD